MRSKKAAKGLFPIKTWGEKAHALQLQAQIPRPMLSHSGANC